VSKLYYFAVNEHTKYKPIRCELNDNDKYPVKNPQWLSAVPLRGYDVTCSGWDVPQAAAICTALPYDAGIFLFPATMPSTWSSQSQSELVHQWWLYRRVNSTSSVTWVYFCVVKRE